MKNNLHITMTQRGEKKKGEKERGKKKKKEREPDQNKLSKHILIAKENDNDDLTMWKAIINNLNKQKYPY